jgi:hypothetical protein
MYWPSGAYAHTDPTKGVFSIVNPTGAVVRHFQVGSVANEVQQGWIGYSSELRVENGSTLRVETNGPNFNITDAKPFLGSGETATLLRWEQWYLP